MSRRSRIDSISLDPDAVLPTLRHVAEVEKARGPQEIVRGAEVGRRKGLRTLRGVA